MAKKDIEADARQKIALVVSFINSYPEFERHPGQERMLKSTQCRKMIMELHPKKQRQAPLTINVTSEREGVDDGAAQSESRGRDV